MQAGIRLFQFSEKKELPPDNLQNVGQLPISDVGIFRFPVASNFTGI